MLRSLNTGFLRNVTKYLRTRTNINGPCCQPIRIASLGFKILMSTQVCCAVLKTEGRVKIDVEDNLREACEEGYDAIILLMDTLKDFVLVVCEEYRTCLTKQIEITEIASKIGPLSETWDQLPHYRTLADELSKELDDYMAVLNTIGQMTAEESLMSFVTGTTVKIDLIAVKYRELNALLQKELAQNKEIELKLLKIKRDSILGAT